RPRKRRQRKRVQTRADLTFCIRGSKMQSTPNTMRPGKKAGKPSAWWRAIVFGVTAACLLSTLLAQAGRRAHPTSDASTVLNVVASRANGSTAPITSKDVALFDNGVEQTIKNFAPDLS